MNISTDSMTYAALLDFAEALGCSANHIRRHGLDGILAVFGRRGDISVNLPEGYHIVVVTRSPRAWAFAKRALVFAAIVDDADDGGMFSMDRLPTPREAEAIRHYVGVSKKRGLALGPSRQRLNSAPCRFRHAPSPQGVRQGTISG
jgi:hypothetical protein